MLKLIEWDSFFIYIMLYYLLQIGVSAWSGRTLSGEEFVFRILGSPPTREYLEANISRKIKAFVGLT
jgi:hypothetical protein